MKICHNCGASNPDNRSKCEYCKSYIGEVTISKKDFRRYYKEIKK